ncbi:MAG TPA: hypothetical protein VIU16_15755, partial [Gaiellaceae bacterium]
AKLIDTPPSDICVTCPAPPAVLRTPQGRAIAGIEDGERFVGLVYLGPRVADPPAKERRPVRLEFLP